jgi:hypothetical protein
LFVDSGGHLIYNPDINTLYVSFLEVTQITSNCTFTAIVSGATAAPGTNTTQLATTAFVQSAVSGLSGFLTKTGTQTGINTTLQLLNSSSIFKVQGSTVRTYLCMDAALDRVEIGELRVLYGTVCQGGLTSGDYVSVTGTSNPRLEIGGTLVVGKASAATGLIDDSAAGDMCVINYTNDIRFAARQNSVTNLLIANTEVVVFPTLRTNAGLSVNSGGVNYANIGFFGASNISGDFTVFSTGGTPVFYMSQNGITGQILASKQYNWLIGGATVMNITSNNVGLQMGSMFDFSVAGGWDNSKSLYITTGGLGGNNSGVGMGFNTTLDSGLLCSIAPNVAWKRMSYKANDHRFYTAGNTLAVDINQYNVTVERQGLQLNNPVNPYLYIGAGGGVGNYIAQATTTGGFINDSVINDLCINSRTGNISLAGGAQYGRTNLLITNDTNSSFRPFTIASDNARLLRLCYPNNSSGYGVIHYNDGGAYYILLTPNGTPLAEFNGLRPFYIDLGTGRLHSNNGQTFQGGQAFYGGLQCDSFTAGLGNGNHVALNGGNGFYMVGGGNQPTGCYLPAGYNLYKVYISTTGNQFGTNDQWWAEAVVRYNNNSYNCSVTTTASNNVQVSGDANGHIYCYCPGGSGVFYAWVTWQRVI